MKSHYYFIAVLIFFGCGTYLCYSQEVEKNENFYRTIAQIDRFEYIGINNQNMYVNAIRIQQIGNNNSALAKSYASGIEMNLEQLGDNNYIESIVRVGDFKLNAIQKGDNNYFSNFPIFSEPGTQLEVIQEGDNQHVENNGTNAISKNMSIRIIGNDRMLTIQNIN